MMVYKNLLVMLDPTKDDQPCLRRAIFLARSYGAKISVLLVVYDLSYEMTSMLSQQERDSMREVVIAQHQAWLKDIMSKYSDIPMESTVAWHNRPFEAAIEQVKTHGHDLLIKSTHNHDKLKSVIFTPTDWHLLRKSPCDILLVKEHDWPTNGTIATAINSVSEDNDHMNLNNKVLQHATDISKVIGANVKVINAYPGTPVSIAIEIPEFNSSTYNDSVKTHHQDKTYELTKKFNIAPTDCIIDEGLAEDVIPRITKSLNAELLIIGTIGRTGLSAAFIGNTAEHVIDSIDCDLLAVKPDGFECPV